MGIIDTSSSSLIIHLNNEFTIQFNKKGPDTWNCNIFAINSMSRFKNIFFIVIVKRLYLKYGQPVHGPGL